MKFCRLWLVFILVLLFVNTAVAGPRATRDLVFDDEKTTASQENTNITDPQSISVRTTLDLTRNGQTSSVLPTHKFLSGDKVVLRYVTNADGYVYWLAKMSSGNYSLLFPNPQTGMNNFITRNQEHTIPAKGAFKFDNNKGQEELLMVFSIERVPELEQVVAEVAKQSDNTVQQNATQVAKVENNNSNKRATRDLVFDDEDEGNVNTRSQVSSKGEPFVAYYVLSHE